MKYDYTVTGKIKTSGNSNMEIFDKYHLKAHNLP